MVTTPKALLTLLADRVSREEDIVNEAILKLEGLGYGSVLSRSTLDPSALSPTPSNGDMYIVPPAAGSPAPSGAFAGQGDNIALYYSGWRFIPAYPGATFWIEDEAVRVQYRGVSGWVILSPDSGLAGQPDVDLGSSPLPADGDLLRYDGTVSPGVWRHYTPLPPKRAVVGLSAAATSQDYTTATNIPWDTAFVDDGGWWTASAPTRLSVPSGVSLVRVHLILYVSAVAANGSPYQTVVDIRKNGSTFHAMAVEDLRSGSDRSFSVSTGIVDVVGGTDYFEARLQQSTDTAIDISETITRFSIEAVF